MSIPGTWAGVPETKKISTGEDDYCKWPEHIKITLTAYPAKSEWQPIIYVYETAKQRNWNPLCFGAPGITMRQQALTNGSRRLFSSTNASPILNSDLLYIYKGTTADGAYTIHTFFPVNFPLLADSWNDDVPPGGIPFDRDSYMSDPYYKAVSAQMEAAVDADFTPNLELLDAVVESITVKK